jgi:hypothetical protein
VGESFSSGGLKVLAVEVRALRILSPIQEKSGRIQARTEPQIQVSGPPILHQKLPNSEWPSWLISMDPRGNINPEAMILDS